MNTQPIEYKAKAFRARKLAFLFLVIVLLLAACSPSAPTPQPPTPLPAEQTDAAHAPVILRVEERTGNSGGYVLHTPSIYFMDPDGDATTVVNKLISTDPAGMQVQYIDDPISASASAQKHEASVISPIQCRPVLSLYSLTFEYRIRDSAGNLSTPVTVKFSSPATPPNNAPLIYVALVIALVFLAGFWLIFRRRPAERISALQSTLLLFFSLITSNFMGSILHEGGHALANLVQGGAVTLFYAHPFAFSGYVRPFVADTVLTHMLGYLVGLLIPLVIFILIWKRRSISNLPLVMLFPFSAILAGITMSQGYDTNNVVRLTGMPESLFTTLGILLFITGIFFMISTFPLLGLAPENIKSLFVVPAAFFIQGVIGLLVAYLCIPGSPADILYLLGYDLMMIAHMSAILIPIIGLFLAVIYVGLYRWIYRKLPAGLRTETVNLTWKDLRIPGFLAAISLILGVMIIT
jgi:hypothetical protein